MDLFGPEPDFGALARSMGCYGEGPIDKPQDVKPALLRALAEVKKGRCALVDTITQHSLKRTICVAAEAPQPGTVARRTNAR